MIPRLKLARNSRLLHPTWPSFEERRAIPLFLGRLQYRRIVVLLDADVLAALDLSTWSKEWLLAGLLTLDVVDCIRYADGGPPDDVPRKDDDLMGQSVPGWAILGPEDRRRQSSI
jgi:hypothetical protein